MNRISDAIAAADDQPATAFRALQELVQSTIGARLFTLMEYDAARHVAWRSWSNMPKAYPVTGEKPVGDDRWTRTVVRQGKLFVANSVAEFADVFSDHELIRSLGCESCVNVPVFVAGQFRGSVNCLDRAGHYTPERVALFEDLRGPAAAVFMLAAEQRRNAAA